MTTTYYYAFLCYKLLVPECNATAKWKKRERKQFTCRFVFLVYFDLKYLEFKNNIQQTFNTINYIYCINKFKQITFDPKMAAPTVVSCSPTRILLKWSAVRLRLSRKIQNWSNHLNAYYTTKTQSVIIRRCVRIGKGPVYLLARLLTSNNRGWQTAVDLPAKLQEMRLPLMTYQGLGFPLVERLLDLRTCKIRRKQFYSTTFTLIRHRWMRNIPSICAFTSKQFSTESEKVNYGGSVMYGSGWWWQAL